VIFLAAGLGTIATTHFAASAIPLCFGILAVVADQDKAGWIWLNVYVAAAIVIGAFRLLFYLNGRLSAHADNGGR
jgi:hypothetical protein